MAGSWLENLGKKHHLWGWWFLVGDRCLPLKGNNTDLVD